MKGPLFFVLSSFVLFVSYQESQAGERYANGLRIEMRQIYETFYFDRSQAVAAAAGIVASELRKLPMRYVALDESRVNAHDGKELENELGLEFIGLLVLPQFAMPIVAGHMLCSVVEHLDSKRLGLTDVLYTLENARVAEVSDLDGKDVSRFRGQVHEFMERHDPVALPEQVVVLGTMRNRRAGLAGLKLILEAWERGELEELDRGLTGDQRVWLTEASSTLWYHPERFPAILQSFPK